MVRSRGGLKTWLLGVSLAGFFLLTAPTVLFAEGEAETVVEFSFSESCGACHGSEPEYPVLGARLGYDTSGHKNNANSYYANGGGCQRCHTNEGFIEFVNTGKVEGFVEYPSQPGCFTCHTPHETGDFTLRTTKPVQLADGSTFDLGEGNLCANCHQARQIAAKLVQAMPAEKVSSHWGAHHGPQSDLVNGTNAWEFPGKSYSSSPHKAVVKDGCATCHMALPEGRYAFSPELGGHSFRVAGEVHEAGKLNVSSCVTCHEGIKQVRGEEIFDLSAKADYDLDGTVEPLQAEVEGLLERLVNHNGTGLLQKLSPPMYKADGSWNSVKSGQRSLEEVGALYNYKFILEDRSKGVHNATYAIQVLHDSIAALDPSFISSKRP